ncbi:hypothetical protein JCM19046_5041 [Bacillus sp. JCM 19046]|nr:hypothetical protein JCM19045_534 [Bacillus sp. JCM 19045]GAF20317.1 hypothetical protein JCM19046_5041 [Bacillus sp. JCM 19046]
MKHTTIRALTRAEDWLEAYPIMHQLRTHLTEEEYLHLVAEAVDVDRYLLYALYEAEDIAAVVGFKEMTTLYNGRFIWVCDLITDKEKRSLGYGEKLLMFVHNYARKNDIERVSLSSGLQRRDAHRFYEDKMGYAKTSYVFLKQVSN